MKQSELRQIIKEEIQDISGVSPEDKGAIFKALYLGQKIAQIYIKEDNPENQKISQIFEDAINKMKDL
jgi:hypothetical protein